MSSYNWSVEPSGGGSSQRSRVSVISAMTVSMKAIDQNPVPHATPMAETVQMLAAVVSPFTLAPD